jgi:uncharacterized integral membrane protein (TIGR00697 family)
MKKQFIFSLFIACVIISNVITNRLVLVGSFILPGAFIIYGITFLCTDLISELYGKKESNQIVIIGFILSMFLAIVLFITSKLPEPIFAKSTNNAFSLFFKTNYRIVIGSMVAYLVSQKIDIFLFHFIKSKTKYKWIRNNGSTMISQFVDTVIFIIIAFYGGNGLLNMILAQYIFKLIVAAADTPIFYLLTRQKR